MVRQSNFWFELILMLVVPLPLEKIIGKRDTASIVYIEAINWIDNAGNFDS